PEGRARDVVEPGFAAARAGFRVSAVLATDRKRQIMSYLAPALAADTQKFADTLAVQHVERILWVDSLLHVYTHEATGIIARKPVGHLCQIVGAERQERRVLGDFAGAQCRARCLDHHPEPKGEFGL